MVTDRVCGAIRTQDDRKFTVRVPRVWSPHGADRLFNLVRAGWFTDTRFYRVVPGFVAQFGMQGQPAVDAAWRKPAAQVRAASFGPWFMSVSLHFLCSRGATLR